MNNGLRPSDRRGDRKRREEGLNIEVIISHPHNSTDFFSSQNFEGKSFDLTYHNQIVSSGRKSRRCRELFVTFARSSGMCFIRGRRCSSKLAVIEENGISRNHYPTASSDGYVHPDDETVYKCGFVTLIPIRQCLCFLCSCSTSDLSLVPAVPSITFNPKMPFICAFIARNAFVRSSAHDTA